MREILFRGKHTNDGHWIYGAYCPEDYQCDFPCILPKCDSADNGLIHFEVEPRTVGEFSGYRDSNGREIFEGDVIKFRVGRLKAERRAIVEFGDGVFQARCGKTEVMLLSVLYNYTYGKLEVIGNIHDDPELLREIFA